MLRRAAEVAAITGGVALVAGIASLLGLGVTRALPAIVGAGLVAGLVFFVRTRAPVPALAAAVLSSLGAFALDAFVVFVLGAGYPDLRWFRVGPIYPVLVVLVFGAVAAIDVGAARGRRSAQ